MIDIRTMAGEVLATLDADTMRDTDFSGGTFREADLSGVDLSGSKLHAANLEQASLVGAKLRRTDLSSCDLRYADLRESDLQGANLRSAQLNPCELQQAHLCGADLSKADVHGAHFHGAKFDGATVWPSGFDPLAHGCVLSSVDGDALDEAAIKKLLRNGKLAEALPRLQTALVHTPRNPRVHHLLALTYARMDDHDYALKHFLQGIALDPQDASLHTDTAVLYGRLGLPTQGVEHLRAAARLAPTNEKIGRMLAEMRARAQH